MTITREAIVKYIETKLGGSDIEVDLKPEDYDNVIEEALDTLSAHKPRESYGIVQTSSGVQRYELDKGTYGRGVIQVQQPLPRNPLYNGIPFPDAYVVSAPIREIGDYALMLTKQKEAEYLFGGDFNFDWDQENGILMIKPPPLEGCNYVYRYLDVYTLSQVGSREHWLKKLCLALAKQILGNKWRKFRAFPGNENQVEMYTEIHDEGKEEEEALVEEITRAGQSMVPAMPSYRRG